MESDLTTSYHETGTVFTAMSDFQFSGQTRAAAHSGTCPDDWQRADGQALGQQVNESPVVKQMVSLGLLVLSVRLAAGFVKFRWACVTCDWYERPPFSVLSRYTITCIQGDTKKLSHYQMIKKAYKIVLKPVN